MKSSAWIMYNAMIVECQRRGYDPDMMLGLARVLPNIHFVRPPGGYVRPVWRGKILGRTRTYRPDIEVK